MGSSRSSSSLPTTTSPVHRCRRRRDDEASCAVERTARYKLAIRRWGLELVWRDALLAGPWWGIGRGRGEDGSLAERLFFFSIHLYDR